MRQRNLLLARTRRHDMMLTSSFIGAWVQLGKNAFELGDETYLQRLREIFHRNRNANENNGNRN